MLGNADASDRATRACDLDRRLDRLVEADTFEHRIDALTVGQSLDALDRLLAALTDDLGRAEVAGEPDPVFVAAHDDDLVGAEPLRSDYAAETDCAVTDYGDACAGADLGQDGSVVAGAHHVGEREQRRHECVVLADRQHVKRAVGLGNAHGFRLRAGQFRVTEEPAVKALGLEALLAEEARAVGVGERHDDEIAGLDRADIPPDLLDNADRLVTHDPRTVVRLEVLVGPEVGAANAGTRDADHPIGRRLDLRIGDVLDPNVACRIHHCAAHYWLTSVASGACPYSSSLTCSPQVTGLPLSSASCMAM